MSRRIPFLLGAAMLFGASSAQATPSFEKTYSVKVKFVDGEASVTVHQDHADPKTFYYLPRKPQLVMTQRGKVTLPRYRFQRFQFKDPNNPNGFLEGAVMQFAVTLALSDQQLSEIRNELKSIIRLTVPDPNDKTKTITRPIDLKEIDLKQIPIRSSTVTVYDPATGDALGKGLPPALSPTTLNADIPFTVKMDVISAQLAESLADGTTGITCIFRYDYDVISEPAGFKVTVDWDSTFSHFSKNKEEAERTRGGWWLFSWDTGQKYTSTTEITESLVKNSCVKIDVINNKVFTAEKTQAYMQPILDAINKELQGEAPPKIDAAKAKAQTADSNQGVTISNSEEVSKNIKITKTGKQEWNFNAREVFSLSNPAQGFVEVGVYLQDPAMKALLIPPTVTDKNFEQARISLPVLSTSKEQGITSVTLEVMPTDGNVTEGKNELVKWIPDNAVEGGLGKWKYLTAKGGLAEETEQLTFGLEQFRNKLGDSFKQKMGFRVKSTVNYKVGTNSGSIEHTAIVPMYNGNVPLFQPLNHLAMVDIDPELLEFADAEKNLSIVDLTIVTADKNRLVFKFKKPAVSQQFPIKLTDGKASFNVDAKLVFGKVGGKTVPQLVRKGTLSLTSVYLDPDLLTDPDWFAKQEAAAPEEKPAEEEPASE